MARTSYSRDDGERLSTAVVNAIAEHEDTAPNDVRPQLYDVVDPDALDALFGPRVDGKPRKGGRIVFDYHGHTVSADSDGDVYVDDADEADASSSDA
jgi:hypothetical protein